MFLRKIFSSNLIPQNVYNVSNNPVCVTSVRFRRKPRWLPVAKSKMFRVPERKKLPEDERLEIQRLYNIYRTQMRSVTAFLREEYDRKKVVVSGDHLVISPEEEEREFIAMKVINDQWNLECAKVRNERIEKENAERREYIQQRLELKKIREQTKIEQIEEIVRKEKECSKDFITIENIDQAIEFALANPSDYNFSIDTDGNKYHGRLTVPGENKPTTTT